MRSLVRWFQNPLHLCLLLCSLVPVYLIYTYIKMYAQHVPIIDQWSGSTPVAIATARGTLTLDDLLVNHGGHWHFFNNLSTAFLTRINGWNIEQETWLNLIGAFAYFVMLVYVFARQYPHLTHLALIPFSLLIFYLPQQSNWLNAFYATWFYVPFFVLYAIAFIISFRVGWYPLIGAVLCTLGASLSFGTGIPQWFVLPFLLWTQGYRRWQYYAFWFLSAGLTIGLYLHYMRISPNRNEWSTPELTNLGDQVHFVLILLGAALARSDFGLMPRLAIAGLGLISANLFYLWSQQRRWQSINVWITLVGYTLAAGASMAIGRVHLRGSYNAAQSRYITVGMMPWIVLAALIVIVLWQVSQQPTRKYWQTALVYANVVMAVLMLGLYARSSLDAFQTETYTYPYRMFFVERPTPTPDEQCVLSFPNERHDLTTCRKAFGHVTNDRAYQLALYGLAVFREHEPVTTLPETYQNGSPIIISSPSRWLSLYIRDWMLKEIDPAAMLHLAPPEADASTETYSPPLARVYPELNDASIAAIADFTADASQIWYISTPETAAHDPTIISLMEARDFIYTIYPIQAQRYRDANFTYYRFQQRPTTTATVLTFGEEKISLEGWTLYGADNPQPCGTLRLQSWWRTAQVPLHNYSVTLVMVAPDGNLVSQKDAAIGEIYMQLMQPDQLYLDERVIGVPCDLPAGEYKLLLGIYHQIIETNSFPSLPAFAPDGTPLGERPILTTFEVE